MGEGAVVLAAFLGPILGAALGKDDTRMVLNLIESLLKAKDPAGYTHVMEIVGVFSDFSEKTPAEQKKIAAQAQSNPAVAAEFRKQIEPHIMAVCKADDKK